MLSTWTISGLGFVAYATASFLWSPGVSPWAAAGLGSLIISFLFGYYFDRAREVWLIFLVGLAANVVFCFTTDLPFGLFGNPNFLGCSLVLGIAGAIAIRHYWFVPVGIGGTAYSASRGAILALGFIGLISIWRRNKWIALSLIVASVIFAVQVKIIGESPLPRLGIWQDTLNHLTPFGHGWGSFYDVYYSWPNHINMVPILERPGHAYNDALEIIFNLGVGAITLWVMIWAVWQNADKGQKLICFTFLALSLTFFPLHLFPLGQLLAMTLGQMAFASQQEIFYEIPARS